MCDADHIESRYQSEEQISSTTYGTKPPSIPNPRSPKHLTSTQSLHQQYTCQTTLHTIHPIEPPPHHCHSTPRHQPTLIPKTTLHYPNPPPQNPTQQLTTRHVHFSPSPLIPLPLPTIYIITYAKQKTPCPLHLIASQMPQNTPFLYTLDVSSLTPPPRNLCLAFSGIAPEIQDYMAGDARARRCVVVAVGDLFGERERRSGDYGNEQGRRSRKERVAMSVCCEGGTHRSVAVAEMIAQGVKREVGRRGEGDGVRVICRHVHRVKGRGDPF